MTFIDKLKEIRDGWLNKAFTDPEIEKMAETRAIICAACEFNTLGLCGKCGCPLAMKTRSPKSSCPIDKWSSINIENNEQTEITKEDKETDKE